MLVPKRFDAGDAGHPIQFYWFRLVHAFMVVLVQKKKKKEKRNEVFVLVNLVLCENWEEKWEPSELEVEKRRVELKPDSWNLEIRIEFGILSNWRPSQTFIHSIFFLSKKFLCLSKIVNESSRLYMILVDESDVIWNASATNSMWKFVVRFFIFIFMLGIISHFFFVTFLCKKLKNVVLKLGT